VEAPRKGDADSGVELLTGVVGAVEGVQRALVSGRRDTISSGIYDTVRAGIAIGGVVARMVGAPSLMGESGAVQRAVGVVNGAFDGDVVPAVMTVRLDQRRVALDRDSLMAAYPSATGRVVVFLHGLVETERSWFHRPAPEKGRTGTDFGSRLAEDLSCSPVYVRYHTGRHISENGRDLVELLAELVEEWPVPVTEIVLIGHSMGGLVARSAVHQADGRLPTVTRLVCLGSPHTGAPLERGVVRAATLLGRFGALAPVVRLLALRSDGIKDLAGGSRQPALSAEVRQYFVVATLSRAEGSLLGRLVGDLMVTPSSAGDISQAADVEWLGGLHHFDLLHHDTVYDAVLGWLRAFSTPH
jgi:pimeloyl-ACP methyl ester carboxylesterase